MQRFGNATAHSTFDSSVRLARALHPEILKSPHAIPDSAHRWFPADEDFRSTAYERLLPPLVARIREEGAAKAALAALKNGKSNVICDKGKLAKVSKDKHGVIKQLHFRERVAEFSHAEGSRA